MRHSFFECPTFLTEIAVTDPTDPNEPPDSSQGSSIHELEQIFEQVAELPKDQQHEKLEELCPDVSLRQQVRELLDADSSDDQLLDHSLVPNQLNLRPGEQIEEYKLLQELGQGGMGVVFLAEQLEPVRRKVALKVIKPGVDTREVIARFDAERQALSLMDHPNIAKVLDAGTTDKGRPFFVMELVKGQAITTYCAQNQLSTQKRLELFLAVCHAIQHAHQKGIIHRDIKPSNVLVAEYDERPVAKVIDFGVAKAINQPLTEMSVFTQFGQIIGTFEYMSPEQSRINQLDVDTRTDIYSLGVLLYELLTGSPPFEKERLRSVAWEEMLRIIREEDPPKPSRRLSAITQSASGGTREKNEPAKLGRLVQGELDWIVMKAMDKDRNRRYETPNELASDVECFLNGDAVSACPPSPMYRFRKFAKRNKVAIATSAIVAVSLIAGLIGTTGQAIRALRAEAAAEKAVAQAQEINAFMAEDLFGPARVQSQLSSGSRPDPNPNLITLLERARAGLDERFADQPEFSADLKATLASSFNSAGRHKDATQLYEELFEFWDASQGRKHPETILVMRQLARAYIDQSRLAEAEPLGEEALENSRHVLGEEHRVTIRLLNDLGILYQKQERYEIAQRVHRECLEIKRRAFGDEDMDTLDSMSNLAVLYEWLGRFEAAEKLHAQVLEIRRRIFPADDPRVATSLNNLGKCYLNHGKFSTGSAIQLAQEQIALAVPLLREGLEIHLRVRGADHPDSLEFQSNLVQAYCELGRHDDAEPIVADLAERLKRLRGAEDATTLEASKTLGWTYMHQNRLAEAEHILNKALNAYQRQDPRDRWTLQVKGNLATVLNRMGKLDRSILLEEETLDLAKKLLGPDHPETLSSIARLGLSYLETGRTLEGQTLLVSAFHAGTNLPGAFKIAGVLANSFAQANDFKNALVWTDRQIESGQNEPASVRLQLATFLDECGSRLINAKAWVAAEKNLRECLTIRKKHDPDSADTYNTQSMLGEALSGQQKYSEAKPLLVEAYQSLSVAAEQPEKTLTDINTSLANALDRLIALSDAMEDMQEAGEWRKERANVLSPLILP